MTATQSASPTHAADSAQQLVSMHASQVASPDERPQLAGAGPPGGGGGGGGGPPPVQALQFVVTHDERVVSSVAPAGWAVWQALALRALDLLSNPDVGSLVITHGSDTLEETAYFLSLVLPQAVLEKKAVVLTCGMRPASALAPDGPQNLRDALVVARAPDAVLS